MTEWVPPVPPKGAVELLQERAALEAQQKERKELASRRVWITCHMPDNKRGTFSGQDEDAGFANMKEAVEALADAQRNGSHNKCGHSFGPLGHGIKRGRKVG